MATKTKTQATGDVSPVLSQQSEAPKAEAPKAEAPKAEAPKAEAPKAEAPKAEAPKAELPTASIEAIEAANSNGYRLPWSDVVAAGVKFARVLTEDKSKAAKSPEAKVASRYMAAFLLSGRVPNAQQLAELLKAAPALHKEGARILSLGSVRWPALY